VIRLGEYRVFIKFWGRFAIFQHFLETEQMTVDALPVSGPSSVLEMTVDCTAEKSRAMFILKTKPQVQWDA
jgi:hypothetical protein